MKGRKKKNIEICSRDPAFKARVFFSIMKSFREASVKKVYQQTNK